MEDGDNGRYDISSESVIEEEFNVDFKHVEAYCDRLERGDLELWKTDQGRGLRFKLMLSHFRIEARLKARVGAKCC